MRIPNTAHTSRPWRIHELTRDFRLEDVWALPTPGGPDDFPRLVRQMASADPSKGSSRAARALFAIRWKLGELLGWDDRTPASAPGCRRSATGCRRICATPHPARPSTRSRSPRCTCSATSSPRDRQPDRARDHAPRLGPRRDGRLPRPDGRLREAERSARTAYMAAIRPFRHLIVYPADDAEIGRTWRAGNPSLSAPPRGGRPHPRTPSPRAGRGADSASPPFAGASRGGARYE